MHKIYITTLSLYIMFTPACFEISVSSSGSSTLITATWDCIWSHKSTVFAQDIITSHNHTELIISLSDDQIIF